MFLRKMVEIQGIPENTEENTLDIVTAIANKRGIPLTHDNIDYCYRSKSKKAIVVRFMQTHARNKFYSGSRIPGSKLMAKDIGYSKSNNQIFVNEYLTFSQRSLFHKVRNWKKDNQYKFAWTRDQKIYLRKAENSKIFQIHSDSDLKDLPSN